MFKLIDWFAMIVPLNAEVVPRVAELPTCHRNEKQTMATFHSVTYCSAFVLALVCSSPASAQSPSQASPTQLEPVTVIARLPGVASVAGWGDVPLSRAPLQGSVFSAEQIKDSGVQRLSDLTGFDPALSDAYNTEGYWDFLTVRGFVLDNRFNFRRDGLPINAETSIPLDNKARIEILKGASGIQAGTSVPGGLVKRALPSADTSAIG